MTGEFDDVGAVTQAAVSVECRHPPVRGGDRGPDRFGNRDTDGDLGGHAVFAQAADVGEELVTAVRRIRPDEDRAAIPIRVWDLQQGLAQDGDMVGGGVAARRCPGAASRLGRVS